ncbi:hypothetical protein D3C80_1604640 [compost metagenome]
MIRSRTVSPVFITSNTLPSTRPSRCPLFSVTTSIAPICVTPRGTSMIKPLISALGALGVNVEWIERSSPRNNRSPSRTS